jgi:hypothetical protein
MKAHHPTTPVDLLARRVGLRSFSVRRGEECRVVIIKCLVPLDLLKSVGKRPLRRVWTHVDIGVIRVLETASSVVAWAEVALGII